MTTLRYTQDNLPTPEEFRRQLAEAMAQNNPLDELLELAAELRDLEHAHEMTSGEFFEKYQRGEMGDDEDIMHWAMLYESYLHLKKQVESALIREAVSAELAPVGA